MGCYASKVHPPDWIVVERENDEDELTVEGCDYGKTPSEAKQTRKILKEVSDQFSSSNDSGQFIAVYRLVEGSYVSKAVLKVKG